MPADPRLGWRPELAIRARARHRRQGVRYARVRAGAVTPPPALSLARYRLRSMNQGQVGTCHEQATAQCAETYAGAHGLSAFPLCRNLIGYGATRLEGGGNPADGAAVSDDFLAISDTPGKGLGACREDLWPYVADPAHTGAAPPAAALAEAARVHFSHLIDVGSLADGYALLASKIPFAIGVPWPGGWGDQRGWYVPRLGPVDPNEGHAVAILGRVAAGVWPGAFGQTAWVQVQNSWDDIYQALPAALAALVPGYVPSAGDRTADFWVPEPCVRRLLSMQGEAVAVTGADGLAGGAVDTSWDDWQ